jgi:hypothetical protein
MRTRRIIDDPDMPEGHPLRFALGVFAVVELALGWVALSLASYGPVVEMTFVTMLATLAAVAGYIWWNRTGSL